MRHHLEPVDLTFKDGGIKRSVVPVVTRVDEWAKYAAPSLHGLKTPATFPLVHFLLEITNVKGYGVRMAVFIQKHDRAFMAIVSEHREQLIFTELF